MTDLSAEERTRYQAYRRELRQARLAEMRAYCRARYAAAWWPPTRPPVNGCVRCGGARISASRLGRC